MKYKACEKCKASLGWINIGGNSFIAIVKMFLGWVGGSTALFADGIHSFGDVLGSLIMLISLRIAARPKDEDYPHGYGKVEFLAAAVIYTCLLVVGFYILMTAVHALTTGIPVDPDMVTILGAVISLVANELMYRQSICCGSQLQSPSIIANAHEKRADALSSIAVLAGIIGAKLGLHFLDPLAALMVSYLIFKLCISSLMKAARGLMDGSLEEDMTDLIKEELEKYPELGLKQLRTREIGQEVSVEIDAYVDPKQTLKEMEAVKNKIKKNVLKVVERPGDVTIYLLPNKPTSKIEVGAG